MSKEAEVNMPVVRGSCLCGGVKYEITGPLLRTGNCHCSNCRKALGALSAFRSPRCIRRIQANEYDHQATLSAQLIHLQSNGDDKMTIAPGRFDYAPITYRPSLKWPNDAHVAFWVAPNMEFFEYL